MNFQSNAPKPAPKTWKLAWWHILLFAALLLAASLLLFPQKLLIDALTKNGQPSQLAVVYLRNLAAMKPQDIDLHITLAKQELGLGNLKNADLTVKPFLTDSPQTPAQWQAVSIHYQVLRSETYAFPEKSPERAQGESQMKQVLYVLARDANLTAEEAKSFARDALSIDNAALAVTFYDLAIKSDPSQTSEFFANAGKVALYANDYQNSAKFYILAMTHSDNFNQKRDYYIAAMNSIMASGQSATVMTFAEKNIDGLANDQQTLLFLAKMALRANDSKAAQNYIKQALQIQYLSIKKPVISGQLKEKL